MNNKSLKKYGWPQHPSKYFLKRIYGGTIPHAKNFVTSVIDRYELDRFLCPVRIDSRDFNANFGFNLDTPIDYFFETQLHEFIEKVLKDVDLPFIEITTMLLKRLGRIGCLYRNGFSPKSPSRVNAELIKRMKQLESEIKRDKIRLNKRRQFDEERIIHRQEARKIFDSLHEEDQYNFLQEFDHAKEDPSFKKLGGEFEDFLILKFKLKITLFEEMRSVHRIKMRLREIKSNLKGLNYKWKKDEIEWTEFVRIFKASENELSLIGCELNSLEAVYK
jgi:hypothetical protein